MMPSDYQRYIPNEQRNRTIKRIIVEVLVAVAIIVPAIFLSYFWRGLVLNRILKKVALEPNSDGYDTWIKPPIEATRSYRLFNVSNPTQFVTEPSSTSLDVTETRDYIYSLETTKENVEWSDNNTNISYSVRRWFHRHETGFHPSFVNDTGIFVDLLRATFRTQFQTKASQAFFDVGGNEVFYYRQAVEQLEGFTSELFETMRSKMTGPNTDKSGFVYRYNGSLSYKYKIKAGLYEKGQVLAYQYEHVPFSINSPSEYPFALYDGLTFVPNLFDKKELHIFQPDICRPIRIQFVTAVDMFGMKLHKYTIKLIDFKACLNANDSSTCPEVDRLDVSDCISASLPKDTIFLTKPHFYGSNSTVVEEWNIKGMSPSEAKHESSIFFEPYSGTPLKASHRIQLNIDALIDPMRTSSDDETRLEWAKRRAVRRMLPLLWIDQDVSVSEETIKKLRVVLRAHRYGPWIVMALAIGLTIAFVVAMELWAKRATRNKRHGRGGYIRTEALYGRSKDTRS